MPPPAGGALGLARRAAAIVTSLPGRILITVGLLAIVARSIEWDLLVERLAGAAWGWFVLATGLIVVAYGVATWRWHMLLLAARLHPPPIETVRAYAIGAFTNNLLPTSFGGDAVRAWIVARKGAPLVRSLTSVVTDRGSAFICLIPLAWLGVVIAGDVPTELIVLLAVGTALTALGGVLGLVLLRRRGLGKLLPDRLQPWAAEVAATLRTYLRDRGLLTRILALGLVFQTIMVTAFWALNKALGLAIDPAVLTVVLALVLLASLVPISIAGFGVREGAFVALLAEVGTPASDAVLLSLLSVAAIAIASLPGGIALMVGGERPEIPAGALDDA